jgi:hypothetical protein
MEIAPLAAAVAVPVVFALLRRAVPAGTPPAGLPPLDVLRDRYARWEAASLVPIFGFTALLTFVFDRLFLTLAAAVLPRAGAGELLLLPDRFLWALPALFLAIPASAIPTMLLYRKLLGDRYPEYAAYGQVKAGFDVARVSRVLFVGAGLLSGALLLLGLDHYTRFGRDAVTINGFFGLGPVTHGYADVRAVRLVARFQAPNGNIVERPHLVLEFRDGSRWSTRNNGRPKNRAEDQAIAALVAARSGVPIEQVDRAD